MNISDSGNSSGSLTEQEELYQALTEKALSGEHMATEYLKNITELSVMRQAVSGLKTVIKFYDGVCKSLYRTYCEQVAQGKADFNLLYTFRQNQECKSFYIKELATAKDMIDEYWTYVRSGHFLDQWLFFETRDPFDLWDHRKDNPFGN